MITDEQRLLLTLPPPGGVGLTFEGMMGPGVLHFIAPDGGAGDPVPAGYVFTEPTRLYLICDEQPRKRKAEEQ